MRALGALGGRTEAMGIGGDVGLPGHPPPEDLEAADGGPDAHGLVGAAEPGDPGADRVGHEVREHLDAQVRGQGMRGSSPRTTRSAPRSGRQAAGAAVGEERFDHLIKGPPAGMLTQHGRRPRSARKNPRPADGGTLAACTIRGRIPTIPVS